MIRVLHITDFHVANFEDPKKNLREANYRPFVSSLVEIIRSSIPGDIDYIISTGDYIDKGQTENFGACGKVLKWLANELSIQDSNVITCIGNHDFKRALDRTKPVEARKEYQSFADQFNIDNLIHSEDILKIYFDESKDIYIAVFDSTFGSNGEDLPQKSDAVERDRIYKILQDKIPTNKPLFVLSHFPMDVPNRVKILLEEPEWAKKHVWSDGNIFLTKLNLTRKGALTGYFHGDGHIPDFWKYSDDNHFAIMTGMIGGVHDPAFRDKDSGQAKSYNKITEVKVVEIESGKGTKVYSYRYENLGYEISTDSGEWREEISQIRSHDQISEKNVEEHTVLDTNSSSMEVKSEERVFHDNYTQVISLSVEQSIIDQIAQYNLYSFGPHRTSSQYTTLGWVDIDSLMNDKDIFARCVEESRAWIKGKALSPLNTESTVYVGLDFWGSCLAAQVSVLTEIHNHCIATKDNGRYDIEQDKLRGLISSNTTWTSVFLFSDVVSTGVSIQAVSELILDASDGREIKIYSISVISDVFQKRSVSLDELCEVATFCSKIRLPIIANKMLPNEDILPLKLDISADRSPNSTLGDS